MKLRFEPDQPHQRVAMDAVLDVLRGHPYVSVAEALRAGRAQGVVANEPRLPLAQLWSNLNGVQQRAGLPVTPVDPGVGWPQLTVDMETGTGKTYVYLRTVLELARRHGLRKVVVVVPSVAVREGVLKTLRITRDHFEALLPGLRHRFFAYDGQQLGRLRTFACSSDVELMVLTLDAFNKARNRMRQPHDGFGGRTPLALLQAVRPVVVLDEPQRMESPRSRAALADLDPVWVLRYSATHRTRHALVHRLTPRQAYEQGLVKRIEVAPLAVGIDDRTQRIAAQVRATVQQHLRRQAQLRPRGIKVLSLLFVERVEDWAGETGIVRRELMRCYDELKAEYPAWAQRPARQVCAAYFAMHRKRGAVTAVDSRTGHSAADGDAYTLIMRDKERLLSLEEPVCFVVSHSALREGWDNPNVFQICTLAPSRSAMKKRQEIGRGVRLAVDDRGHRVRDPEVNVLTVVANDSYEDYVTSLQAEDAEQLPPDSVAPPPLPVGAPADARPTGAMEAEDIAWRQIDGERLRADAREQLRSWPGTTDDQPGPADLVAAVTQRLLWCRPPMLVGRATIEMLVEQVRGASSVAIQWHHVDAVVAAIVHALGRQGVANPEGHR
ncbi:MAG: DEAD/DEAH box helicase family protein [Deltaproteobacteria bacterium]|nr:DEAD/DEAH box helicase family protein [Deltaproteobacteria bacterium]